MKTYKLIISFLVLITVGATYMFALDRPESHRPFQTLTSADIKEVSIYSLNMNAMSSLTPEETNKLVGYLKDLVLYGKPSQDFKEYSGGRNRMFSIHFSDGSTKDISASNPFIIFDGTEGYKTEYIACDELFQYYYQLVEDHFDMSSIEPKGTN